MAEIGTVSGSSVIGAQRNTFGTFSKGTGVASGEITTGLSYINSATVLADTTTDASSVKVELNTGSAAPENGTIKITAAGSTQWPTGTWSAIGYGGG